jgi:hypothetical protein
VPGSRGKRLRHGATIAVESPLGIPRQFQLIIADEGIPRADKELGLEFELSDTAALMYHGRDTDAYQITPADPDAYIADRVGLRRAKPRRPLVAAISAKARRRD